MRSRFRFYSNVPVQRKRAGSAEPATNVELQTSNFERRTSNVELRTSNLELVHSAHSAWPTVRMTTRRLLLLLGNLGDEGLGRQQQGRDGRGVLQRIANHLRGIDH